MSGTRSLSMASSLLLALLAVTPSAAEDHCPLGAVNTITGNYGGPIKVADPTLQITDHCEICLVVRVQVQEGCGRDSWEEVGRVCDLWTDAQAHDVMFKIGQCGLIVPVFEGVGQFYGSAVPIRVEAVRLPPCQ